VTFSKPNLSDQGLIKTGTVIWEKICFPQNTIEQTVSLPREKAVLSAVYAGEQ